MLRYAITDRTRLGETDLERLASLVTLAERWATEGIDYIQIREKDLSAKALLELSLALAAAVARTHQAAGLPECKRPTQILINSRPDLALAAGLDGVHLTAAQGVAAQDKAGHGIATEGVLSPGQVRRLYASLALKAPTVSVSCHTLGEVRSAVENNADLILFGPVFGKFVFRTNGFGESSARQLVTPPVGLDALSAACNAAGNIPVLALGGVTQANTPACLQAGAKGIAAITLFNR